MRPAQTAFVGILTLSVLLASCSKGGPGSGSATSTPAALSEKQKSVLNVQLSAEPASLDPAEVEDGVGLKIVTQLREGLVGYDHDGHLKNLLAESYAVSKDGKRIEFKLKPDLHWSDGQPVRVADFIFGIRRALEPDKRGVGDQLNPIRNAREFHLGHLPQESVAKIKADPKDKTLGIFEENDKLVFELDRAAPYFIHALTSPQALPVRQDMLAESSGKWSEDKAPGTGPYRFAAYQPGKRLLIEANPYYWGPQPEIGLIDFLFVTDESTALNLFESGKLDILTRLPTVDLPRLSKLPGYHLDPYYVIYYIAFNVKKAPFDQVDFRRAVSGSIEREELVRALDSGEKPALSWIPPGIEGYMPYRDPKQVFAASIKKIKAQLAAHPLAEPVSAAFDTGAKNLIVMQKIQSDLQTHLGMKVALSNLDWKTYLNALSTDAPQIYRLGRLSPFADPMDGLLLFTTGNVNNWEHWSNATYDKLVYEIGGMAPGPARDKKILEAQKILVEDEAAVVPLFQGAQSTLVQPRVQNFHVNPFGVISFAEMSLKQ